MLHECDILGMCRGRSVVAPRLNQHGSHPFSPFTFYLGSLPTNPLNPGTPVRGGIRCVLPYVQYSSSTVCSSDPFGVLQQYCRLRRLSRVATRSAEEGDVLVPPSGLQIACNKFICCVIYMIVTAGANLYRACYSGAVQLADIL